MLLFINLIENKYLIFNMERQGRPRLDSVLHGLLNDQKDLKRLKTNDSRWASINNKVINNPSYNFVLLEVPKEVSNSL
jgi:hypothetical protein